MTHSRMTRQLSAYLDNELPVEERRQIHAHLVTCAECREELLHLEQVKRLMGWLPDVEVPGEVLAAARAQVARERGGYSPLSAAFESLRTAFRRPAVAAATAFLVLVLVAFPLVKGRVDRLQAADIGVDLYVREHVLLSSSDPFVDRAYLGLLLGDTSLALAGARRVPGEEP